MSISWGTGARWRDAWRSVLALAPALAVRPQDVARGIKAGFDAYFAKPTDIGEVLEITGKGLAETAAVTAAKAS